MSSERSRRNPGCVAPRTAREGSPRSTDHRTRRRSDAVPACASTRAIDLSSGRDSRPAPKLSGDPSISRRTKQLGKQERTGAPSAFSGGVTLPGTPIRNLPMNTNTMRAAVAAAALTMATGGCAVAGMTVPGDLADAPRMEVRGRQGWMPGRQLHFGEFSTSRVSRRETIPAVNVGFFTEHAAFDASYVFQLRTPTARVSEAACGAWADVAATRIPIVDLTESETRDATLACDVLLEPGDTDDDRWYLEIRAPRGTQLSGRVENGRAAYRIDPTTELNGVAACCSTSGYHVRDGSGRIVAAVEVVNDGAVWLHPSLAAADRHLLATVAGAILLMADVPEEVPGA